MVADWPTTLDVATRLMAEAGNSSKALGHALCGWVPQHGSWYSRCVECLAGVVVTPRGPSAPIRGEAATLRCRQRPG